MLFRNHLINLTVWVLLLAGIGLMASTAKAATPTVPVQVQFVSPPLLFGWNQLMAYRGKIASNSEYPVDVRLTFEPHVQLDPNAPPVQGKGGVVQFHRTYHLLARETQIFSFRVYTPSGSPIGAYVNWCLDITVGVKDAAPQSMSTCALSEGK